jgi:glycosyltransferase involved in cell wall biosynthesis
MGKQIRRPFKAARLLLGSTQMNSTSQPLVSIVTPVYNEEEHLAECIESVLAQSYQHWDYTIVDNCSTDRSLDIARRYAARDRRIRIHENKRFLEMLPNHNVAVRQISRASKYCKVVLGDDWIFPGCLRRMVAVGEEYPSVGVVSAYQLHGQQVRITGLPHAKRMIDGREACRYFLLEKHWVFGSQTSVLYRSDLVRDRDPFYVPTNMYADFEACFALLRTTDLGFVHEVLTFSRPQATSIGAIASDTGAYFRGLLDILFTYGRECLSSEEFEESLGRQLSKYYEFLGRRLLVDRDPEFWSYHKKTFVKAGIRFSRARLARAAAEQLCRSILDPKSTVESMGRFLSLRKLRNRQTRKVALESEARPGFRDSRVENGDQPLGVMPSR